MNKYFLLIPFLIVLVSNCSKEQPASPDHISYSTESDSALYYYRLGWAQIMDEGFYGPAETSYRKAVEFDPGFLVGKSVLARLTPNLDERLNLYRELIAKRSSTAGDERAVLDVYIALTEFTNLREQGAPKAASVLDSTLKLAEENFRSIVHKYPGEKHIRAEYIEILHANHGAEAAMDTLVKFRDEHKLVPFLEGYAASLHAETGNFEEALNRARALQQSFSSDSIPKPYVVLAEVYHKMGDLEMAKQYVERAYALDPRNLDASRLKDQIDEALKGEG